MLWALQTFGNWLRAIPGPTSEWADIIGALAWPSVILLIAYWLKAPLVAASEKVADRLGSDHVKIGNWLEITPGTNVIPLDEDVASRESDIFDPSDVRNIEAIFEMVGDSEEKAGRLADWVAENVDSELNVFEFMYDARFAKQREDVYKFLNEQ